MARQADRPGRARPPARRGQRGIALILVLWVIALLVIMAVGVSSDQRTETSLASNQVEGARFRALADAAVTYAVLNLTTAPPLEAQLGVAADPGLDGEELAWTPDGSARTWRFAGEALRITLVNEHSLVDLNQGSKELLTALLAAVEVGPEDADALADAILDWRDGDDLRMLNGAEDPDYAAAGLPYGAKDAPFDSVAELQQVLGFDRALFLRLVPALTVATASQVSAEEFAPPLVQAALQGISLAEAELRLKEQALQQQVLAGTPAVRPVSRGGPLYRIRVSRGGDASRSRSQTMEALVRVEPGSRPPFRVLWRDFAPPPPAPRPDETLQ